MGANVGLTSLIAPVSLEFAGYWAGPARRGAWVSETPLSCALRRCERKIKWSLLIVYRDRKRAAVEPGESEEFDALPRFTRVMAGQELPV